MRRTRHKLLLAAAIRGTFAGGMASRAVNALGCTIFATTGIAAACSSFTSADPPVAYVDASVDAALVQDAGPPGDANEPCLVPDGSALYLFGGELADGVRATGEQEKNILRASVHCDGSLGDWSVGPPLPRPMTFPAAGIVKGSLVVVGGFSYGTPSFADTVFVYGRGEGGTLTGPASFDVMGLTLRARAASVVTNDALVVLGGSGSDVAATATVESIRLDDGGRPSVTKEPMMDHARQYFAAGTAEGHIVVMSRDEDPSIADVATDGGIRGWRSAGPVRRDEFIASVSKGNTIYFIGGESPGYAVSAVTIAPDGGTSSGTTQLTFLLSEVAAAASGGRVYLLGGTLDKRVVSGELSAAGITDLRDEPQLPRGRVGHVAVVF